MISKTKLLKFPINQYTGVIDNNVTIYMPFEVDEIIVDYGIGLESSISNLQVKSNLFKTNMGDGIAMLNSRFNLEGDYYSSNKTHFTFNASTPINGSYNFVFSNPVSGTTYDNIEFILVITFLKTK
jgi:hypothetical protein